MDRIDAVVIGAGVVGLAVARELARAGRETIVVEAETAIGQGISSRNSEVIHAGLYYPTGSNRARLCVRGKELIYAFCAGHGVEHRRCGKWVVASSEDQHHALRRLERTATANGVPVRWLDAAEAMAIEPELRCTAALESPTTGIVDSHGLMLALQGDLERAGGAVALGSAVEGATLGTREHVLRLRDGSELAAGVLVNAAGLGAVALARRFDGLDAAQVPTLHLAKGSYFTLGGRAPFRRLIYPAPVDAWLGVHLTLDLAGQARFGPDLEWLGHDDPARIDYRVDPARGEAFYAAVRRYWPALRDGTLAPGYSGVRPKLYGPGETAADFRIDTAVRHGHAGLVNLFGIESPGLTSALAIAEGVQAGLAATMPG
jgi:L-2-hydroxyglutarate oxidase LhgO